MRTINFIFSTVTVCLLLLSYSLTAQDVALGEAYIVGETHDVYRLSSTVERTILKDDNNTIHFTWCNNTDPEGNARRVAYNFVEDNIGDYIGQLHANEREITSSRRAYCAGLDVLDSRVFFFYNHNRDNEGPVYCSITDSSQTNFGIKPEFRLPTPDNLPAWNSKGTVCINNLINVTGGIFLENGESSQSLLLWHIDANDDNLMRWEVQDPIIIDNVVFNSHHIQASRTNTNVAVAWHHNIPGVPIPEEWEDVNGAWQISNDIYVAISDDGRNWDFDNTMNITRSIPPNPELEGVRAYGDTLRCAADMDLLWVGDVLHVVFPTRGLWRNIEDDGPPAERITSDESLIWHWDSESDSLTLIANGWYENEAVGELFHNTISNVCRPSIAVGDDGVLYCIFRQITEDDVIWGDYCAGEIMLSISTDNGITWSEPVNLTDTHVNEENGELDYCNELHPSLAGCVDANLHIFYELVHEFYPGGESILDPPGLMIYQRVPLADLPEVSDLEMPREGFQYHNYPIAEESVRELNLKPDKFELLNIYPNPFNSTTTIEYALPLASEVTLYLFNLSGQRVETLVNGRLQAGVYQV
ncbi:MAG: hypothetical protein HN757_18600, partial [Calditrichaeota bacterium]|nr:hypothetical protein [Calditrichota bacterium]